MAQGNVEPVRQPIALRANSRRPLDERLLVRFPSAAGLVARAVWRLSPRSGLRRALIRRAFRLAVEATNRRDLNTAFALHHPDVELVASGTFITLGFDAVYRGHEERIRFQERWYDEWGEFLFEPDELIDLGDRVLVLGRVEGSGLSSGAAVGSEWANIFTVSAGRVVREQVFFDRAEGLEAAGLSE